MDDAKEEIEKVAKQLNVVIYEGSGPQYDANVVKTIHENSIWLEVNVFNQFIKVYLDKN